MGLNCSGYTPNRSIDITTEGYINIYGDNGKLKIGIDFSKDDTTSCCPYIIGLPDDGGTLQIGVTPGNSNRTSYMDVSLGHVHIQSPQITLAVGENTYLEMEPYCNTANISGIGINKFELKDWNKKTYFKIQPNGQDQGITLFDHVLNVSNINALSVLQLHSDSGIVVNGPGSEAKLEITDGEIRALVNAVSEFSSGRMWYDYSYGSRGYEYMKIGVGPMVIGSGFESYTPFIYVECAGDIYKFSQYQLAAWYKLCSTLTLSDVDKLVAYCKAN